MPAVRLDSGITLSYSERGTPDGPAVVAVPGPTDGWRSYAPVLAALPGGLRVVAVSPRGHGGSSKPPDGYAVEDLASDLVPFLDAIGVDRALLVGHSGSCLVVRRVALDAPDRVAGLLLEASPTTLRGNADLVGFVESVVADLTDPVSRDVARSLVTSTSTDGLAPELVEALVDDVVAVPARAWREMFTSLLGYDDTSELSRLTAPVRLIWGDLDPLLPATVQDELVDLLPDAELVLYEGVGHTPRWERPARFASDLTAFATRVLA